MTLTAPDPDAIEVSIFGPGKGESVVIHLGGNRWMIVDSCRDQRGKFNPAIRYLEAIGIDLETQVILIVATHMHDDHFAGIAEIFEACKSSSFALPSALTSPDFLALTDADERAHAGLPVRAYSEFRKVFEIAKHRKLNGNDPRMFTIANRVLLEDRNSPSVRVTALSPSDASFIRAQRALAEALPKADEPKRIRSIDPNELAIALWIEAGDKTLLLGADMLTGPAECGWQAVVASFTPNPKADLFKVSHHGSETGDHPEVWEKLLSESPVAILAPFRNGSVSLPTLNDKIRIYSHTDRAYITAPADEPKLSPRSRREASMMGPLAQNIRDPWGRAGQVRARSRIGSNDWSIDCIPPAKAL